SPTAAARNTQAKMPRTSPRSQLSWLSRPTLTYTTDEAAAAHTQPRRRLPWAAIEYVMTPSATIRPGLRTCAATAPVVLMVATVNAMIGWLRRASTATNATTATE